MQVQAYALIHYCLCSSEDQCLGSEQCSIQCNCSEHIAGVIKFSQREKKKSTYVFGVFYITIYTVLHTFMPYGYSTKILFYAEYYLCHYLYITITLVSIFQQASFLNTSKSITLFNSVCVFSICWPMVNVILDGDCQNP